jgi:hypothetical protein
MTRNKGGLALVVVGLVMSGCGSPQAHHRESLHRRHVVKVYKRGYGLVAQVTFVRASPRVREECRRTADGLRYPIPCPTMLPQGLRPTPAVAAVHGCPFAIVGIAELPPKCRPDPLRRGWMFGSSQVQSPGPFSSLEQHLVVQAAPRAVGPERAIDGPLLNRSRYRIRPLGLVRVAGRLMHWYFVPENHESAFAGHLVLVWTAYGHTYAYGFHVLDTMSVARALDLELVRHLVGVNPGSTP